MSLSRSVGARRCKERAPFQYGLNSAARIPEFLNECADFLKHALLFCLVKLRIERAELGQCGVKLCAIFGGVLTL